MNRVHTICLVGALFVAASVIETSALKAKPMEKQSKTASSVYALAGEFRTVAASLLWIRADQYHHEFVESNPDWTKDKDLLGMLNLITELDPHFVEAYSSAAVIYAYGLNAPRRACSHLDEGIAANPEAWELHRMAAIIYARRLNSPANALPYALAAVRYCDSDFDKPVVDKLLQSVRRMVSENTQSAPKRTTTDRLGALDNEPDA